MDSTKPDKNDENIIVTVRTMYNSGKEISSLIGNRGCILRRIRQESGAKISISDGSSPDRIVTVTGSVDNVCSAYNQICQNLEDYHASQSRNKSSHKSKSSYQQITVKLVIPALHCGSVIGKGGCKIKEIRDITDANVQVSSDMLPFSTERVLSIVGTGHTVTQAIYQICLVLIECSLNAVKGAVMAFEPKATNPAPIIMSKGQAYTLRGDYAIPVEEVGGKKQAHPLAGLAVLGLEGFGAAALTPAALSALSGIQLNQNQDKTKKENNICNEIVLSQSEVGCVVGKGASRIFEIREISGADISIVDANTGKGDRILKVEGHQEAVSVAQYLINMCMELQKKSTDPNDNPTSKELDNAISMFMSSTSNPGRETRRANSKSLSDIALTNLSEILANISSNSKSKRAIQTTGAYRREPKKDRQNIQSSGAI